jgi:hypothetical protein
MQRSRDCVLVRGQSGAMVNECLLSMVAIATMLVPGLTSRERVVASRHRAGVLCRGISVQKKCGLVLRLRQGGPLQGDEVAV